ncbi:hypothetical protein, partial [Pantoea ananatis]|uniref:hypothetical protein n=1 Tax=Pantoea ananas TaxID=553 RepID=UPI0023B11F91
SSVLIILRRSSHNERQFDKRNPKSIDPLKTSEPYFDLMVAPLLILSCEGLALAVLRYQGFPARTR